MRSIQLLFALLLTLLLAFASADDPPKTGREFRHSSGYGTTREDVVANRAKRKQQLEKLLEEAKETMENHKSGRNLLADDDFTALERKINAYSRKLETMSGEMDDREVDRVIEREKLREERDRARRLERRQRAQEL